MARTMLTSLVVSAASVAPFWMELHQSDMAREPATSQHTGSAARVEPEQHPHSLWLPNAQTNRPRRY